MFLILISLFFNFRDQNEYNKISKNYHLTLKNQLVHQKLLILVYKINLLDLLFLNNNLMELISIYLIPLYNKITIIIFKLGYLIIQEQSVT